MSETRVSILEYNIDVISDFSPVQISHIGMNFGTIGEMNFGSYQDTGYYSANNYIPAGMPWNLSDVIGGVNSSLALQSNVVSYKTYDSEYAQQLFNAVNLFNYDLIDRHIAYSPVPNLEGRSGNSNSAARYVMQILGFSYADVKANFAGSDVGGYVNLADPKFGLKPIKYYQDLAMVNYQLSKTSNPPVPLERPKQCFPFYTPVVLSSGATALISELNYGNTILAFDASADHGRGALVARRVTNVFRNVTTEWIELDLGVDSVTGERRLLTCTPGHHFLDEFGNFPSIAELLLRGGGTARIVLEDGTIAEAAGRRIVWSEATAHLYGGRAQFLP